MRRRRWRGVPQCFSLYWVRVRKWLAAERRPVPGQSRAIKRPASRRLPPLSSNFTSICLPSGFRSIERAQCRPPSTGSEQNAPSEHESPGGAFLGRCLHLIRSLFLVTGGRRAAPTQISSVVASSCSSAGLVGAAQVGRPILNCNHVRAAPWGAGGARAATVAAAAPRTLLAGWPPAGPRPQQPVVGWPRAPPLIARPTGQIGPDRRRKAGPAPIIGPIVWQGGRARLMNLASKAH